MTKKNDLKQDPIKDKIIQSIELIKENNKIVGQFIIGLLIIFTFIGFYRNSVNDNEMDAKAISSKAQNMYADAQNDLALLKFQNVIDDYNGTDASEIAKYYIAIDYIDNGNIEDGITLLEELTNTVNDEVLLSSVLNILGNIFLDKGQISYAIELYEKSADVINLDPFKQQTLINAARAYKVNGEYKKSQYIINGILNKDDIKYNINWITMFCSASKYI